MPFLLESNAITIKDCIFVFPELSPADGWYPTTSQLEIPSIYGAEFRKY
jgi:hypothetical protein